jgi:hypothetical protein
MVDASQQGEVGDAKFAPLTPLSSLERLAAAPSLQLDRRARGQTYLGFFRLALSSL